MPSRTWIAGALTGALLLFLLPARVRADQATNLAESPVAAPPRSPALVIARVLLVIGGTAMFATGYGAPCGVLGGVTCVPLVGPILRVPRTLDESATPALAVTLLAGFEIMQVAGVGLVLGGALMSDRPPPRVAAAPFTLPGGGGVLVAARF